MLGFKKTAMPTTSEKILTIIGGDTIITGKVQGGGPLRIDGRVQGEIDIHGDVIIGEGAVVEASVKGKNIQVAGKIVGNITANGCLEIITTGVVQGDVDVHTFKVDDGAGFYGSCKMRVPSDIADDSE